jgi:heme/copper-type cytochrome/quinol oxidase subunit 4
MTITREKVISTLVWILLVAATVSSNRISADAVSNLSSATILGIAAIKIMFIFYYFMELNHAPKKFLLIAIAWLFVVSVIVIAPVLAI